MKPSSLLVVALTTALITLCTSFSSGKGASPKSPAAAVDNVHYYFYLYDDTYDGFATTSQEIARLELTYDVYVDTNPFGGTLLARGYANNNFPHTIWASVLLYGHF